VSASKRKKAGKAAYAARIEALRKLNIVMADSGRKIQPGTNEYEKSLKLLVSSLSEEEFNELVTACGR
jgi:hypothetical protein